MKELLAATELNLNEVARLSGFMHPETMYRLFKMKLGRTPTEFRDELRVARRP